MTDEEMIAEWYKHYPAKKAKLDAFKAWRQTKAFRPDLDTLIKAVQAHCKTEQWMRGFIPYPATWLRQGRWDDELTVKLPDVVEQKPWHETWTGIKQKGAELGLREEQFDNPQAFKTAVMRSAMKVA